MKTTGDHAHTTKCLRCGRALRSAASVSAGYGRWCRAKIRAAAIAGAVRDFKDAAVAKARDLIADGGLVPVRAGVFRAVSSDGGTSYLVARGACSCPAGIHGRMCYHRAAAAILMVSKAG